MQKWVIFTQSYLTPSKSKNVLFFYFQAPSIFMVALYVLFVMEP